MGRVWLDRDFSFNIGRNSTEGLRAHTRRRRCGACGSLCRTPEGIRPCMLLYRNKKFKRKQDFWLLVPLRCKQGGWKLEWLRPQTGSLPRPTRTVSAHRSSRTFRRCDFIASSFSSWGRGVKGKLVAPVAIVKAAPEGGSLEARPTQQLLRTNPRHRRWCASPSELAVGFWEVVRAEPVLKAPSKRTRIP